MRAFETGHSASILKLKAAVVEADLAAVVAPTAAETDAAAAAVVIAKQRLLNSLKPKLFVLR